jgi:hypothetical protein
MLKRFLTLSLITGIALGSLVACDADPEQSRSVVFINSFNCGVPVFSDVLEQGTDIALPADDYIAEDWPLVWFFNKPYNTMIITQPGFPHGDAVIESYTVAWSRPDGGPVPPVREEFMGLNVNSDDKQAGQVRLVSVQEKLFPDIAALQGGAGALVMNATLTFQARESGTSRYSTFIANVTVQFADFIVATDEKEDPPTCNE